MNGQHSCKTPEHGTPPRFIAFARAVIGSFDLDPASSAQWNRVVGAERFFDKRTNGLKTPWVAGAPAPDKLVAQRRIACPRRFTVFENPPGDPKGALVAAFWRATAGYHDLGYVSSAIWIGFSLEQLARLQRVGAASHPLEHTTLVPDRRGRYAKKPGVAGKSPTHASFITLLSNTRAEVERFHRLGTELGHVIRGTRWR